MENPEFENYSVYSANKNYWQCLFTTVLLCNARVNWCHENSTGIKPISLILPETWFEGNTKSALTHIWKEKHKKQKVNKIQYLVTYELQIIYTVLTIPYLVLNSTITDIIFYLYVIGKIRHFAKCLDFLNCLGIWKRVIKFKICELASHSSNFSLVWKA